MPKHTITSSNLDAAIAADSARKLVILSISLGSTARFSFGTSFTDADSQEIRVGQPWTIEGDAAKLAISFGAVQGTVRIDSTTV